MPLRAQRANLGAIGFYLWPSSPSNLSAARRLALVQQILRVLHAQQHALANHGALKLGEHGHHLKERHAGGGAGVNLVLDADQADVARLEFLHHTHEMKDGSADAVKVSAQDHVAFLLAYELHHALESWPPLLGRGSVIVKLLRLPIARLAVGAHLGNLRFGRLLLVHSAHAGIEEGSHGCTPTLSRKSSSVASSSLAHCVYAFASNVPTSLRRFHQCAPLTQNRRVLGYP